MLRSVELTQAEVIVISLAIAYGTQKKDLNRAIVLSILSSKYDGIKMPDLTRYNLNSLIDSLLNKNEATDDQWETLARSM